MKNMIKTTKLAVEQVSMNAEVMYLRLLAINATKKVPLVRVLSFKNSPVRLSMFKEDGTMIISKKSEFMHRLETLVPNKITKISEIVDATVYDGPTVIKLLQIPRNQMSLSFSEMASHFMIYIFAANHSREASQIHIVFDRYFKSHTRQNRYGNVEANIVYILPDAIILKDWKRFLSLNENKSNLAKYYTKYFQENCKTHLKNGQSVYIRGTNDAVWITENASI